MLLKRWKQSATFTKAPLSDSCHLQIRWVLGIAVISAAMHTRRWCRWSARQTAQTVRPNARYAAVAVRLVQCSSHIVVGTADQFLLQFALAFLFFALLFAPLGPSVFEPNLRVCVKRIAQNDKTIVINFNEMCLFAKICTCCTYVFRLLCGRAKEWRGLRISICPCAASSSGPNTKPKCSRRENVVRPQNAFQQFVVVCLFAY